MSQASRSLWLGFAAVVATVIATVTATVTATMADSE